jgi:hypothetical protein
MEIASRNRWLYLSGAIAIVALAAVLRVRAAHNDLWLDEIWSLDFANLITSPWHVFTRIHHDNNHYLTTLWFYCIGPQGNWLQYRILSIIAGIGTVILAGLIGRERNMASAFFAMALTTGSYVLILYSSEARGHASVIFFAFLSYYLLNRYLKEARSTRLRQATARQVTALLFSFSAVLGLLSHLIFLNFYFAAALWSAVHLIRTQRNLKALLGSFVLCHALPVAFLIVIYFVDVRYIQLGGGTTLNLLHATLDFLTWAVTPSFQNWMVPLSCMVTLAVFIAGTVLLWREKSDAVIFYVGVIVVFPVLLAFASHTESLYLRHFVIGIAFLLILFSFVLASFWEKGTWGKSICVVLLAAFFVANSFPLAALFKYGRGHYRDAARYIAEHSRKAVVTIGGDHDFRIPIVLQFYVRDTMGGKRAQYLDHDSLPPAGPEWVIFHKESFENPAPPAESINDKTGNVYDLEKAFPTAPLSGLHWYLYHNRVK